MLPIKKKDKVYVIAGDNKGKEGEVVKVLPEKHAVIVAKINIAKKHTKPTQIDPGGIKQIELPIDISNVMLICPKCNQKTKVKFDFLSDGKKVRSCKKCGEIIL
ncbi:MAG: 50S ribosomal protein L24 [Elusimicrobiota bacterium]|nr:50S ribosomal protein L24 [Elusimicrobiota bacterium]